MPQTIAASKLASFLFFRTFLCLILIIINIIIIIFFFLSSDCVVFELSVLAPLLRAQVAMLDYQFKETITLLYEAKLGIDKWRAVFAGNLAAAAVAPANTVILFVLRKTFFY